MSVRDWTMLATGLVVSAGVVMTLGLATVAVLVPGDRWWVRVATAAKGLQPIFMLLITAAIFAYGAPGGFSRASLTATPFLVIGLASVFALKSGGAKLSGAPHTADRSA